MAALLVLPVAELARLREAAAGTSGATALDTHALAARARHERRLQLKQRSDARVAGWSDTIEAKQERKLQWRAERREREEAERARLDREEEALEAAEKAETLARARALLFEQTDAMKTLRSAQRYAAILKTLEHQTEERRALQAAADAEEKVFHRHVLQERAEADAEEQARRRARLDEAQAVAMSRRAAMGEARARKEEGQRAKQREGMELLARALQEKAGDKEKAAQRRRRWRADHEVEIPSPTIQANAALQQYRAELRVQQAAEDAKIAAEVEAIDARERARREQQQARFEEHQRIRQRLIDRACEELAKKTSNEEAILERQIRQQRDKEDTEMARRAELRRRERQAIAEDRVLQRQRREEARVQEREAARRRMAAWAEEDEKSRALERAAAEARLNKQFEMRGHQLRQMEEKAARRAAERAAGRQGVVANGGPNAEEEAEERARFLEMATLALAQAEAEGTPTYPLRRAVHAALYPAPLSAAMVKPKPKKEDKAAGAPAAAAPVKKCVVSSKAAKAPSAG